MTSPPFRASRPICIFVKKKLSIVAELFFDPMLAFLTIVHHQILCGTSRSICVQRSRYEQLFENGEQKSERLREQALTSFDLARKFFYTGNEQLASNYINQAIGILPDDTAPHEFRAVVLFSAVKYRDAADTCFLLAYHYITLGYPDDAERQLVAVLTLKPEDRLSADLLALMQEENQKDDHFAALRATEFDVFSLEGCWRAQRPDGEIELTLKEGGGHSDYDLAENQESLSGKYQNTDNMMLLATEQGSQMVGTVTHQDQDHFTFRLLGASEADPGVRFQRR